MADMAGAYQGAMAMVAAPKESYMGSPTAARLSLLQVCCAGPCNNNFI